VLRVSAPALQVGYGSVADFSKTTAITIFGVDVIPRRNAVPIGGEMRCRSGGDEIVEV
jgi:hypothetical protein